VNSEATWLEASFVHAQIVIQQNVRVTSIQRTVHVASNRKFAEMMAVWVLFTGNSRLCGGGAYHNLLLSKHKPFSAGSFIETDHTI